jgi:hypothetical protein
MTIVPAPAANDNGPPFEKPVVRTLRRRPEATYARSGNVILPLRFARRMTGWNVRPLRRA